MTDSTIDNMTVSTRVPLDKCDIELTPLGYGVRVGNITYTLYGPGMWADKLSADERRERLESLLETNPRYIDLGAFMLLPKVGAKFTLYGKDAEDVKCVMGDYERN